MQLLFIEKVFPNQQAFEKKVKDIAKKHRINPNWLMAVMNSETGGSFSPSIRNFAGSGATGLIQFMPFTAMALNTSTDQLAAMSNVQQLDYVDRYIDYTLTYLHDDGIIKSKRIKDYDDMYLIVFYPAYIGQKDSTAFPSKIYAQNAGIDMNGDGVITIKDFKAWIRKDIPKNRLHEFKGRYRDRRLFWVTTFTIGSGALLYHYTKKQKK